MMLSPLLLKLSDMASKAEERLADDGGCGNCSSSVVGVVDSFNDKGKVSISDDDDDDFSFKLSLAILDDGGGIGKNGIGRMIFEEEEEEEVFFALLLCPCPRVRFSIESSPIIGNTETGNCFLLQLRFGGENIGSSRP